MKMRRLLAGILAAAMTVTSISFNAFADDAEETAVAAVADTVESGDAVLAEGEEESVESTTEAADVEIITAGDWKGAIFGNSTDGGNRLPGNFSIVASSDTEVELMAKKGKISSTQDGIVYYYQAVPTDKDFTISANATINSFGGSNLSNQSSFGLMARTNEPVDGVNPGDGNYGGSIAAAPYRFAKDSEDTSDPYSAIGYVRTTDTAGTLVSQNSSATYPNLSQKFALGEAVTVKEGDTVPVKLSYNSALKMFTLDVNGTSSNISVDELATLDASPINFEMGDTLYVGAFVARSFDVTFTDLKLASGTQVYEAGEWKTSYSSEKAVGGLLADVTSKEDGTPDTVHLYPTGTNKGKLSSSDEEYVYYASEVDENANFTLSADVTINQYLDGSNPKQTAFGLVFRSTTDLSDPSYTAATASERHTPSEMLALFTEGSYTAADGTTVNYQGAVAREFTKTANEATYEPFADFVPTAGETYKLSLAKSGTAYSFAITTPDGQTYKTAKSDPAVFSGTIYPGMFVARNVDVTFSNIDLFVDNRVVESIEVTTPPAQTVYYVGEAFNQEGMAVTAYYDDGSSGEIDDYIVSGFDSSSTGEKEITVVKGSATATSPYTIRKKNVTDITLTYEPLINRYYPYELFSTDGYEGTVTFEDGTSEKLTLDNTVFTLDGKTVTADTTITKADAGRKSVLVSYAETDTISPNGISDSFSVTIYDYTLKGIQIATAPIKRNYVVGEEVSTDGLKVSGTYSDGTSDYVEIISDGAYTVSNFTTGAIGNYEAVVTLNADNNFKATFQYSVSNNAIVATEVEKYPRTTYNKGTDIETIKKTIEAEMVLQNFMSDGTYVTLEKNEYTVNVSAVDPSQTGTYTVTVKPANEMLAEISFDITIWDDPTFTWKTTIFGATSGNSKYNLTNADENGLAENAYLESINGAGKVTNSGHDGIVYYYTRVNAENNFSISADITVDSFLQNATNKTRYGQEAFGIMARDVIPLQPVSGYSAESASYEGHGTEIVVKTENAKKDDNGEPVPFGSKGDDFFSNIIIAGGFATESYPSSFLTAANITRANSNRIKMYVRSGVLAWDGTDQAALSGTGYTLYDGSEFGDYMTTDAQLSSGECFYPAPGDVYHITLTRVNSGYYEECTIVDVGTHNEAYRDRVVGKTFSYAYSYVLDGLEGDPLIDQNSDTIYVGFFAARYASINVSNIDVYESDMDTDYNTAGGTDEVATAGLTITSSLYTTNTNYSLNLKANNDSGGTVVVRLGDEIVANGTIVTKKNTAIPVKLKENTKYDLTIAYTPSKNDKLTSYDTIYYRKTLYCASNVAASTTLYVAPEKDKGFCTSNPDVYGSFTGEGTKASPLDIDTALAIVESSNDSCEIIMLNGTYYLDEDINIASTNYGYKTGRNVLKAETDRQVIVDMQRKDTGITIGGNYWWVKGIVFKNSANNSTGGQLSGSNCIVENCVFAESGTTGFQISGNSSNTYDTYPANNLVVYCESYNSTDTSGGNADGFGCKLTVGNGNIFKNCVSHNNFDDGWDLYTKVSSGPIGATILEDCISYDCSYYLITEDNVGAKNIDSSLQKVIYGSLDPNSYSIGDKLLAQAGASSGNGFKLGGENTYVQHYIKDSVAFGNKSKGIDSNSNPAMKVRNCVSYHNGTFKEANSERGYAWTVTSKTPGVSSNYGLYSGVTNKICNYNLDGAISVCALTKDSIAAFSQDLDWTNQSFDSEALKAVYETAQATNSEKNPILTLHRDFTPVLTESETNWLVKEAGTKTDWGKSRDGYTNTGYSGYNSNGETVTPDWFVSVNETDAVDDKGFISQNSDGSYNLNGFLELKAEHAYTYKTSDIPVYNDAYAEFFGITPITPDTDGTEATTKAPTHSSGGGGGGGSSSRATTTTEAATEATTKAPASTTPGDNESANETPSETPAVKGFTDIADRAWAVEAINALNDKGIVSGVTASTFVPDNNITRGDFCVMISRAVGYDGLGTKEAAFPDVDANKYYANYVAYAAENGYVTGYDDGEFKPNNYITRQEMMVVVAKILGADGTADTAILANFADGSAVAAWAAPYVAYLAGEGIVSGTDTGINPTANITRAQAAVLIYNALDKIEAAKKA